MAVSGGALVQFVPFVSRLDAGFWHELSRRKLEKYHLSEAAQYISGYYTNSEYLVTCTNNSLFIVLQMQFLVWQQISSLTTADLNSESFFIVVTAL